MGLSIRPLGSTLARVLLIAAPCLYLACKADVVSTPTEADPTVPDQPGTPPDLPPPAPVADGGPTDEGGAAPSCTGNPLGAEAVDGATLKVVGQGPFPDGPQWDDTGKQLVYSEVNAQQIARIGAEGGRNMIRWTGDGNLPIGNAIAGGYIFTAQSAMNGTGAILKTKLDGSEPQAFPTPNVNSPNDIVASKNGFVYFTDPGFQAAVPAPTTGVYRMSTTGGEVTVVEKFEAVGTNPGARVDGIALSADDKTLYVGVFDAKKIMKYALDDKGAVTGAPTAIAFAPTDAPTGIAVDTAGNIWIAESAPDGAMRGRVEVVANDGKKWGEITFADSRPTGVAFGGEDGRSVYITAERDLTAGSIYLTTAQCAGVK